MGKISATTEHFTLVHNDYLRDPALDYAEIGVLTVMLSLPDDWKFSIEGLVHRHGKGVKAPDGKYKISCALKGLCERGYFVRERITDAKGRFSGYTYSAADELKKIKSDYSKNFTVLGNSYLRDPALGIEMIGLLTVMLSLPDDWNFSIAGLVHRFGKNAPTPNGEFKTRSLLGKLGKAGYFRRIRLTDEKGKVIDWIYDYSDTKQDSWISENTVTEKAETDTITMPISMPEAINDADILPVSEEAAAAITDTADTDPDTETIKSNIEYTKLCENYSVTAVDIIIKIITVALNSGKRYRINRKKLSPTEMRDFLFSLTYKNVSVCIENMRYSRDIKYPVPYILTALHNSLYAESGSNQSSFANLKEIFKAAKQQGTIMPTGNTEDSIMSIIHQYANTSLIGGEA